MRTDLFDFDLPHERIALRPVSPRDTARLLVVGPAARCDDRRVSELPDLLRPGDQLVFNDTRVIPARLIGRVLKGAEPEIEATLHRRIDQSRWRAFLKPARKAGPGDVIRFGDEGRVCFLGQLDATVQDKQGAEATLAFAFHGAVLDQAIEERGMMPLPPYIASRRTVDERDRTDYQTVFAREEGAVAAPTAGLHFTEPLLARLREHGIGVCFVTLHVGAATFLPVKEEDTAGHALEPERATLSAVTAEALNAARNAGGRIVAVGSTSLRLIESAAADDGTLRPFSGETSLFVVPGYRFRAVDLLFTNFHLPRSTLFMLVAAFAGLDAMKRAYVHAVNAGYRFYSYGDASLLFRADHA
jgi:S-adenosylmethionine:tRNA ribosyltransferase-isomerase